MTTSRLSRHALIVATANYSDPRLAQLRSPAADSEALAEVLGDPSKGDFEVQLGLNESHAELMRRIALFFRDRIPNDLLLLHLSCHGVKDENGELYLAAADTDLDLLSATGIPAAWLNERIDRTRSRRTVLLLDCCFSGSGGRAPSRRFRHGRAAPAAGTGPGDHHRLQRDGVRLRGPRADGRGSSVVLHRGRGGGPSHRQGGPRHGSPRLDRRPVSLRL